MASALALLLTAPVHAQHAPQAEKDRISRGAYGQGPASPPPLAYIYSAIAFHPDASDVWASNRYPSVESAIRAARDACTRVMGKGCEVEWQSNGAIAVALDNHGAIWWARDRSTRTAQRRLLDSCAKAPNPKDCTMIGVFSNSDRFRDSDGENVRHPRDMSTLRKRYGALAWMDQSSDARYWISTGHDSQQQADAAVLAKCEAARTDKGTCKVTARSGAGAIVVYANDRNPDGAAVTSNLSVELARESIDRHCKAIKASCRILQSFPVRQPGLFAYDSASKAPATALQ